MRQRLEKDGIALVKAEEFQTFIAQSRRKPQATNSGKHEYTVTIPIQVARHMGLTPRTLLQIALRKIDKETAGSQFGYTEFHSKQVFCPVCNKQGSLMIVRKGVGRSYLIVMHGLIHGFSVKTKHYIPKLTFPEFYKRHLEESRQVSPSKKR